MKDLGNPLPAPSERIPLVDKLKDYRMQGMWRPTLALFRKAMVNGSVSRWQSFHFRLAVEILSKGQQWEDIRKIWSVVRSSETQLDVYLANVILNSCAVRYQTAIAEDVWETMRIRGIPLDKYGTRGLVVGLSRERKWIQALEVLREWQPKIPDYEVSALEVAEIVKGCGEAEVASTILAGVNFDTNSAELVTARLYCESTWQGAVKLYQESTEKGCTPTPPMLNALLSIVSKGSQSASLMRAIYDDALVHRNVRPTVRTYELLMYRYENSGQWMESLEIFHESQKMNVGCTNELYSNVVRALSRGGRSRAVLNTFVQMKKEGFSGNMSTTLSLINAYSRTRKR